MNRRRLLAYALLVVAAGARLAMQIAAMPPYAGLDELYHVARLVFVLHEHRNPTTTELSVPRYLERSIEQKWEAVPSFAILQARWYARPPVHDAPATDITPYGRRNYEAQQPSTYYVLLAPLGSIVPPTAMWQLRVWRVASALFALIALIAIAFIGETVWRWRPGFSPASRTEVRPPLPAATLGFAAAALLAFVPTWETLVMRASNDALAVAALSCAIAVTVSAPKRWIGVAAEALLWALAVAVKLYTWPVAIVVPLLWWRQRAPKRRVVAVIAIAIVAAGLTMLDLSSRSRNPLGVVAFDRPGGPALSAHVDVVQLVKVTVASAAWTSGEHWDAMRRLGIALYVLPILFCVFAGLKAHKSGGVAAALQIVLAPIATFALMQVVNVVSCVLARRAGNPVPIGGGEGWYWFVLAPILVPFLLAPALRWRAIAWWIVLWDVVITDCQLIATWAGLTSPSHPSVLFRWGPLHLPPAWVVPFRVIQIAALALLLRRRDAA